MTKKPFAIAAAAALALTASVAVTNAAEARDQIRIVGSSTVFPFATVVAEEFGKTTDNKTPVVESTAPAAGSSSSAPASASIIPTSPTPREGSSRLKSIAAPKTG